MARDKEPAGAPLWMVTYSDMVTLLLTFFVMLLAMANFDDTKRVDAVLGSIQASLGMGSREQSYAATGEREETFKENSEGEGDLSPLRSRLEISLSEQLSNDLIKLTDDQTEIRLTLSGRILFPRGGSELHPVSYQMVTDIARALAGQEVAVQVEGHSDWTGKVEKNWEVSAQRALAVVYAIQDIGTIPGEHLQATGMGQYRPSNLDRGDSEWNRRVEIVIRSRQGSVLEAIEQLEGGI